MNAAEIMLGVLCTVVVALSAYIWKEQASEIEAMAARQDRSDAMNSETAQVLAVCVQRLQDHLDWSQRTFTPGGSQRPGHRGYSGG